MATKHTRRYSVTAIASIAAAILLLFTANTAMALEQVEASPKNIPHAYGDTAGNVEAVASDLDSRIMDLNASLEAEGHAAKESSNQVVEFVSVVDIDSLLGGTEADAAEPEEGGEETSEEDKDIIIVEIEEDDEQRRQR